MFCVDVFLFVSARYAVADSFNPLMDVDHVRMAWRSYRAAYAEAGNTEQIIENLVITRHANCRKKQGDYKFRLNILAMCLKDEALEAWEALTIQASMELLTLAMFPNREL